MARLKSKYRQEYRDGGRVDSVGEAELSPQPITAPSQAPAPSETPPQPAAPEPLIPPPEAIPALKAQLEALKASEGIQQQQQTIADTEARRMQWVRGNALAQKFANHLGAFHNEALQAGLADMSPQYFGHMENQLNQLAALQAQTPPAEETKMPAPKFRTPPPAAGPPLEASGYSAPVSRDVPGAGGKRQPGKVTLTNAEVEAARISGISIEEYAKNKIEYERQLRDGSYRDARETQR